jgi:hypothetical protein
VLEQDREGKQVIHRDIEKSLDLPGVQIEIGTLG